MPRNIVTEIPPMMASVSAAFFACGRRKAGTPLEMASTPVSAVAPEENARRITNSQIACTAVARSGSGWRPGRQTESGQPPVAHRAMPATIMHDDGRR